MSEKHVQTGICAVCGKHGEVFTAASACGAITLAYCSDCLSSGAEPWGALAEYISLAGIYPDDINEQYREIVRDTCARLGKTEQEFAEAVKEKIMLFDEMCGQYNTDSSASCQEMASEEIF